VGHIFFALWAVAVGGMMISNLTENIPANIIFLLAAALAMGVAYFDQQGRKRKRKK
jgi:hypothetical protein